MSNMRSRRDIFKGTEKMKYPLISKEINNLFNSKTSLMYFSLLCTIISYSFYSSVDLYSKASIAAQGNPLYAAGFEPVPGVFNPTFGGLFIILSLIAPFLLIRSISNEKNNHTLTLLVQLPYSIRTIFFTKLLSAIILIVVSIMFFIPIFFFWHFIGGHIPLKEATLLISGYFFYGLFIVSVSFFSATLFSSSSGASIVALFIIMLSWFVDFGKDMNIMPFLNTISQWTITNQMKEFENGILSIQTISFFLIVSSFFSFISYHLFNFNIRNKIKPILFTTLIHLLLLMAILKIHYKLDISESRKTSFSAIETQFLRKLSRIKIKIFLDPTDGRSKDYEKDFLKKLLMIKNDTKISYARGKSLNSQYGIFQYTLNNKSMKTYSNSAEEIFMILKDLSGIKIKNNDTATIFTGFPLVVKGGWSKYMFIFYLIILPFIIIYFYYSNNVRRKIYDK